MIFLKKFNLIVCAFFILTGFCPVEAAGRDEFPPTARPKRTSSNDPLNNFRLEPQKTVDSAHEIHYNPFGSAWAAKLFPNKDIPIGLTPGCSSRGPKEVEKSVPAQEVQFLKKSNHSLMYSECDRIDRNIDRIRIFTQAMKSDGQRPEMKVFGYYLIPMAEMGWEVYQHLMHNEEFFLHRSGTEAKFENRLMTRNSPPSNIFVMNIGNPAYQTFVAEYIKKKLEETRLDGFLSDWVNDKPLHYSEEFELVDDEVRRNWPIYWGELLSKVRKAIGPQRVIIANCYNVEHSFLKNIVDPIDGVMIEDLIGSKKTRWKNLRGGIEPSRQTIWENATRFLQEHNKITVLITNSNANCSDTHSAECFGSRSIQEQRDDARYYTAAFLNIMKPGSTIMFYYTPTESGPQFLSETFFTEWDLPIGKALNASEEVAEHVYARKFENAEVIWNNSDKEYVRHFNEARITADHLPISTLRLKPESGEILMSSNKYEARNPSFEFSHGWTPVKDNWGQIESSRSNVRTGKRSIRLEPENYTGLKQPIFFDKNRTYELSLWIKPQKRGSLLFKVASGFTQDGTDQKEWSVDHRSITDRPEQVGKWKNIRIEFKPVSSGDGFFYASLVEACDAVVWIDDVQISERPRP